MLVAGLIAVEVIDLATNSELEGPLWLNIVVMTAIARLVPVAPHAADGHGAVPRSWGWCVMAVLLTQPPNMFAAVLMLVARATRRGATWAAARAWSLWRSAPR